MRSTPTLNTVNTDEANSKQSVYSIKYSPSFMIFDTELAIGRRRTLLVGVVVITCDLMPAMQWFTV